MTKQWVLSKEAFDNLLAWLDSDRDRAGEKYENIRHSLIRIFAWRGCATSEDLADETINRVARKLPEFIDTYSGDPALYFYGVARILLLEYQKSEIVRLAPLLPNQPDLSDREGLSHKTERGLNCLERCLEELSADNREFVLNYYREQKQAKIDFRRELAKQLGISTTNLRVRMHRIRTLLHACVLRCLQEAE